MNKTDLSLEQLILLQSEMRHAEKSLALAYFMLIGGHLGVHRFYLRRFASGGIQLALFLVATACYFVYGIADAVDETWRPWHAVPIAFLVLSGLALFIWIIVDMCILPRMVREWNSAKEAEIISQITQIS
ncbi:TM2 domain-containing protein [Cohnella pontilimi]|uniref:TM2 domain-containing protein n=1 Tax=Cohnella pontilimi TaxID=2564100 RepID=A0A4U0F9P8_9BACL|nr:NINE protein [Cohnella pontilimi]TJY39852.1 TM2 domain-containing protein [Cohnella pontilimi]